MPSIVAPDIGHVLARSLRTLLIRHAAGFVLNFVGTLIVARVLGPAGWGAFAAAFTIQVIAQGLIERGTSAYLIQRRAEPDRATIGTITALQVTLGLASGVLLWALRDPIAALLGSADVRMFMTAVALSMFPYALRAVPAGLLERRLAYGKVALVELSDIAAFNALAIGAALAGDAATGLAVGTTIRAVTSLAVGWTLEPRFRVPWRPTSSALDGFARFVAPYSLGNAISWANIAAAPFIVGGLRGTSELGVLQLAYTLILYPQILTTLYGRVAFPAYSRVERPADLIPLVEISTGIALRVIGGGMLALAISAPLWVTTLYGPAWAGVSAIMLTVAPALGISMASVSVIAALNALGRPGLVTAVGMAFTVLYWVLGALLVPPFGAIGLTLAQVVATLVYLGYFEAFRRVVGPISLLGPLRAYAVMSAFVLTTAIAIEAGATQLIMLSSVVIGTVALAAAARSFTSFVRRQRVASEHPMTGEEELSS